MFQIRNQEIGEKKQIMLQYPGAKVTFGDSFDTVSKKLVKYEKEQKESNYKAELKKMAIQIGASLKTKKGGTAGIKDLEKNIAKVNKNALKRAEAEADLKMEALRMDIANTKSTIANRGKETSNLVPYYVTQPDGTISQAMNDDGTPVMIPKDAQIYNTKPTEETPDFGTGEQQSGFSWSSPSTWFNSWGSGN